MDLRTEGAIFSSMIFSKPWRDSSESPGILSNLLGLDCHEIISKGLRNRWVCGGHIPIPIFHFTDHFCGSSSASLWSIISISHQIVGPQGLSLLTAGSPPTHRDILDQLGLLDPIRCWMLGGLPSQSHLALLLCPCWPKGRGLCQPD